MIGNLGTAFLGVVGTDVTPVVYTLTLDDLSTRFMEYDGAAASIKFKLTATNGGGALTTSSFVYLDSSQGSGMAANVLDAVEDVATLIQTQLNALAGYSGVTANGVATVPGDQWDFTITFPGGLGVTNLAFHASSQWHPTVTLIEAVTQQGVEAVTGVAEVVTISAGSDGTTTVEGQSFEVVAGLFITVGSFSGFTLTGGGTGNSSATYTADATGAVSDWSSGNPSIASVNVNTQGVDAVTGQPEIHTITAEPTNPTGGYWEPGGGGGDVAYNADEAAIANQIFGAVALSVTASGTLDASTVTITTAGNGPISDTALSPVSDVLTLPEVTHSIA